MTLDRGTAARALLGRDVAVVFALLVVPVAVGAFETSLMTPLALPGYLLLTVGSWYGSHLLPNFALWLFWVPFVAGSYGVAVVTAAGYRTIRRRTSGRN